MIRVTAANEDLDRLLEFLQGVAVSSLRRGPSFPTSGAMIGIDGRLTAVEPYAGSGLREPEREVGLLEERFRAEADAGTCRALGYCVDVRARRPGSDESVDAILATLESWEGTTLHVFTPYSPMPNVTLGTPWTQRRRARVLVGWLRMRGVPAFETGAAGAPSRHRMAP